MMVSDLGTAAITKRKINSGRMPATSRARGHSVSRHLERSQTCIFSFVFMGIPAIISNDFSLPPIAVKKRG
jgi:hypothetical protein